MENGVRCILCGLFSQFCEITRRRMQTVFLLARLLEVFDFVEQETQKRHFRLIDIASVLIKYT